MLDALPAVEIDAALVSGLLLLAVGGLAAALGNKRMMESGRFSSEGETLVSIGELVVVVGMVPLIVYTVTRAFGGIFTQAIVGFIALGILLGVDSIRLLVIWVSGVLVGFAVDFTIIYPLRILAFVYANTIGRFTGDDTSTDDTDPSSS